MGDQHCDEKQHKGRADVSAWQGVLIVTISGFSTLHRDAERGR